MWSDFRETTLDISQLHALQRDPEFHFTVRSDFISFHKVCQHFLPIQSNREKLK